MDEYNEYNDQIAEEIESIHKLCNLLENYKKDSNQPIKNKNTKRHKTKSVDFNQPSNKGEAKKKISTASVDQSDIRNKQIQARFKNYQIDKQNHLHALKKKLRTEEHEKYKKAEMSKNSRELARNNLDFITRMTNYKEKADRKRLEEQQEAQKKKEKDVEKTMQEFHNRYNKKYQSYQVKEIVESLSSVNEKKMNLEKLTHQFEEKEKKNCTFQPNTQKTISKLREGRENPSNKDDSSKKREYKLHLSPHIVSHSNAQPKTEKIIPTKSPDFVNRLYNEDIVKRREKKEILEDVYSPAFSPYLDRSKLPSAQDYLTHSKFTEMRINLPTESKYQDNQIEESLLEEMLRQQVKIGRTKKIE